MVSKARLDLPEPESPVTTISASRGSSRSMPLRLWARAPEIAMRSERAITIAAIPARNRPWSYLVPPLRARFRFYGGERAFPWSAAQAGSGDALSARRPPKATSHDSVAATAAAANPREACPPLTSGSPDRGSGGNAGDHGCDHPGRRLGGAPAGARSSIKR